MENDRLPLTEHLGELRKRILITIVFLFAAFICIFNFSEILFNIISFPLNSELRINTLKPYIHVAEKPATPLVFLAPAEAFWMHMKIAFVVALIISMPVIFYQLWRFISPGLLVKERKYLVPFVLSATVLFSVGAAFCFFVVLPFAMTFLLGYRTQNITPMISVGNYVDFCLKFILAFGAVFELPLVIIFLVRFGIVSPKTLSKNRKYAVLFAFIAAGILTPTPDAFNQILMAVPIIILYEIGIMIARIIYRKKVKEESK